MGRARRRFAVRVPATRDPLRREPPATARTNGLSREPLDEMAGLVEASGGRTLGLFSSRRAAKEPPKAIRVRRTPLALPMGRLHCPSWSPRLRGRPADVPLRHLTFWQGVDVPGWSCHLVVIDRIPFPRPDDPLASARERRRAGRGQRIPRGVSAAAALLLAQGVGRLIRHHERPRCGRRARLPPGDGAVRGASSGVVPAVLAYGLRRGRPRGARPPPSLKTRGVGGAAGAEVA